MNSCWHFLSSSMGYAPVFQFFWRWHMTFVLWCRRRSAICQNCFPTQSSKHLATLNSGHLLPGTHVCSSSVCGNKKQLLFTWKMSAGMSDECVSDVCVCKKREMGERKFPFFFCLTMKAYYSYLLGVVNGICTDFLQCWVRQNIYVICSVLSYIF